MTIDVTGIKEKVAEQAALLDRIRTEVHKVVVGQEHLVSRMLIAMLCRGHVLLEGVPGLAKTTLVNTLARVIEVGFKRIQFTPDLLPADLIGTLIYNQAQGEFTVKRGPIFSNIILADEINRAPSKVQSALLEAMQERQVTIGDETYKLDDPFLVMATQNPIEQEGTYPLPEAQMDRFLFKIIVDYPERDVEREVYKMLNRDVQDPDPVMGDADILRAQAVARRVPINDTVLEYVLSLVRSTRARHGEALDFVKDWVLIGSGPRGGQALITAAKVRAALAGRPQVTLDDVRAIARPVLRHRIVLNYNAEAEGQTPDSLIGRLLETVPAHATGADLDAQARQVLKS